MPRPRTLSDFFKPSEQASPKVKTYDGSEQSQISSSRRRTRLTASRADLGEPKAIPEFADVKGAGKELDGDTEATQHAEAQSTARMDRPSDSCKRFIKSSDDEASDTDSSLDDLDDLLAQQHASTADTTITSSPSLPYRIELSHAHRVVRPTSAVPVTKKYKFSLASMVSQTEKEVISEAHLAQAESSLNRGRAPGETSKVRSNATADGLDTSLLQTVVNEDEGRGGMQKVLHAMKRTEALSRPLVWYFFDPATLRDESLRMPFPNINKAEEPDWRRILNDPLLREMAFISGFVAEMVKRIPLPQDIITWMLNELIYEAKDDLKYAYSNALKASDSQISLLLDHKIINSLLARLGATAKALSLTELLESGPEIMDLPDQSWEALLSVIHVLEIVAPNLSLLTLQDTICTLCRLSLDISVCDSSEVLCANEAALLSLFDSIPTDAWPRSQVKITTQLINFTPSHAYQNLLLSHIPAYSDRLGSFRHHLAVSFFLTCTSSGTPPADPHPQSTTLLSLLTLHLQYPPFSLLLSSSSATATQPDYPTITAVTSILDLAIPAFIPSKTVTTVSPYTSTSTFIPDSNNSNKNDDEKAFNLAVDNLAHTLKQLFTSITDSGASHMRRTECKDGMERVYYRLIYGVRTKPRGRAGQRVGLFGTEEAGAAEGSGHAASTAEGLVARLIAKSRKT